MDWLCLPRLDSPSTFAALLGDENHGRWQVRPTDPDATCTRHYDADTFVLNGKAYRVADIEVPLSADPKCRREAMLADRAKQRLKALLNAGPLELRGAGPDEDVYGRKLRTLHRDGRSLGATLISEGLARPAGGNKGWCT